MLECISLFSGIGAYERAASNIGQEIEIVNYCENDLVKSKAYSILHGVSETLNLGDITQIDLNTLNEADIVFYSPPCQSFSIAGKRKGDLDPRGTLFYNAFEVIQKSKPKYCIMENVSNLTREFKPTFDCMLELLASEGYNNYWQCINSKDFLPQNRDRVYIVSIRKDIDNNNFTFPTGTKSGIKWEDIIDMQDFRPITNRQSRMIDTAFGKIDGHINIEGIPQLNRAVITLRASGLRFQDNDEYPAILAYYGKGGGNFTVIAHNGEIKGGITPRNCFKLMGFEFEDSELLTAHNISNSNQYIMAGDTVCVPVLEGILQNLLQNRED